MTALKLTTLAAVLLSAALLTGCGSDEAGNADGSKLPGTGDNSALLGAGATFPYPLYSKMLSEYGKTTGVKVNYQSIGSGGGILQLTNKTVDFGASDAPLNEEQTTKMGAAALHIPVTLGAVVISYNLPEAATALNLSPAVIADLFLGNIKKWNDPKIAADNPGANLPATPVIIAHRSDGSGTTNVFTDYLSKVSPQWESKVGRGTAVNWPAGLGGKGNEGVAGLIKQTPGAIGYVELAYALQNKMSVAAVKNKTGSFIAPSVASISAAANVSLPADSKVSLTNTDAADGYPISGFSWILIYAEQGYNQRPKDRAEKLLNMIRWMTHDGQQFSEALHYARLPEAAVTVGDAILKSATHNGEAILK